MMVAMDSRRMCPHCRAFITTSDRVCPYCNEPVAPRAVDRGVAAGLYLATSLYSMKSGNGSAMSIDVRTLVYFGAKFGPFIAAGEWWRLVTAGFLHGGLVHILMNSWVLFDLGAAVEEIYGAYRML